MEGSSLDSVSQTCDVGECVRLNDLWVVRGNERALVDAGLDTLDALCTVAGEESLTKPGLPGWRERIRLRLGSNPDRIAFLKRYNNPPRPVRHTIQTSHAGLEWHWMRALAADGIRCAVPIAFGEEFRDNRERRSALLTVAVPGRSLETWAEAQHQAGKRPPRQLLNMTADLIARFHDRGYIHRDLYLAHIFHDGEAGGDQSLHLIDLQRVFRPSVRRSRWIIKDLASLNYSTPAGLVTRTDRLRWLKRYLGSSVPRGEARRLAYRVIGKTQSIARHDSRRNRALSRMARQS